MPYTTPIHKIDLPTWHRRHIYECFRTQDFPYINMGVELDVTNLCRYVREEGISFYFSMIFAATKTADEIENFHYRILDDEPVFIEKNTAFATHLQPGNPDFVEYECEDYPTMKEFARENRRKADLPIKEGGLPQIAGRSDILNFSCIPWVRYTHFVRSITTFGKDSNPMITIGRFEKQGDRMTMPFSVQVHHGLMDGYQVSQYVTRLQQYLDACKI